MSRSITLWIGAFLFVIGLVFGMTGLQDAFTERHYQAHGIGIDAIVVDKSIDRATLEGNPSTRYLITYRVTLPEGREIEDSGEVSGDEWERLDAGKKMPVTYLPDAGLSRLQGNKQDTWIAVYVFLTIGGIFTVLGGGLALREGRAVIWSIRISRHGLPTEGTVVRVEPTSTSINRVGQWRLYYRYRDHVGRNQEGKSHLLSPDEASIWHEGETGAVRFDRDRPQESVWIGRPQA